MKQQVEEKLSEQASQPVSAPAEKKAKRAPKAAQVSDNKSNTSMTDESKPLNSAVSEKALTKKDNQIEEEEKKPNDNKAKKNKSKDTKGPKAFNGPLKQPIFKDK